MLFHVCCAPCAGYLAKEFFRDFELVLFFYNPNIWPQEEYEKRLSEVRRFCQQEKKELIVGEYENTSWLELTKGHEQDPEGGERCSICFKMRLKKTAQRAKELGIKKFSTSLAVSPYKNLSVIKKIGNDLAERFGLEFIIFSETAKKDLWLKSRNFSRQEHFYHQKYCGCRYSI